jgi:predicted nucleic acid-binding Zn ribbon protein
MRLRSRKSREDREKYSLDEPHDADDGGEGRDVPFIERGYEFAGDLAKLRDCVKALPPGYRKVVELRMQELEHGEIAEALGFTEGCSKSQWNKAKQKLTKMMMASRRRCPECGSPIKPKRSYCSPTCALVYAAHLRRKIDPQRLAVLHKVNWLSRNQLATIFGVTRHGINNIISRYKLTRFLPKICRIYNCQNPVIHRKHCKGHLFGNLCEDHRRAKAREYAKKWRRKHLPPCTPERKREQARQASLARWKYAREKAHVSGE